LLVSVGGIETAEQAFERVRAGATLVQIYTAFIYEGPLLARRLALGMERCAREAGFASVEAAIGVDAPA
jgi:dihydroorotate dehydrogenase